MGEEKGKGLKLGVVLCSCGGVLEEKIDFKKLKELAESLEGVVEVRVFKDLCKNPEEKLAELKGKLDGIIFGGCSERSSLNFNEDRIKKLLKFLGINEAFFEVVNLREQCVYIHDDPVETTNKALDQLLMGYEKVKTNVSAFVFDDVNKDVLVIGGGVAGMACAQALSDLGISVTLVEEKPYLGGNVAKIPLIWQGEGYPAVCTSECLVPVMGRDTYIRDNIKVFTNSQIVEACKVNGNFKVKIEVKPQFVDPAKCIGCGKCAEVCPEEVDSEFDIGLKKRKVIDKDFRFAMPDVYNIIEEACTKCGKCVEVCPEDAINLDAKPQVIEKEFGAVVLATGFKGYDMSVFENLGYKYPNVITLLEFERLWANRFKGKPPISIAFVLCQKDEVGYCSRLCCLATLKHSVRLAMAYFGTEVNVFYKSLRSCGRAFEEFRRDAEERGVAFMQEEVKKIEEGEGGFLKVITDKGEYDADLVVLAEPLVPSQVRIAKMFGVQLDKYGFPIEFQPRNINTLETHVERVFVIGSAKGFKDIQESVESGRAVATQVYNALKGTTKKYVSITNQERCSRCGICVSACCPHGAIAIKEEGVVIDPAFCKGCGLCYSACPSHAITLLNFEEYQVLKMAETAFKHLSDGKPRLLGLLCYWCAYAAADYMGVYRIKAPENFRSIRIRCSGSISMDLIMEILGRDLADGILIAGCPVNNCHHIWGNYIEARRVGILNKVLEDLGYKDKIIKWEYIGVTRGDVVANDLKLMNERLQKIKNKNA